jgi:hypothetical protein
MTTGTRVAHGNPRLQQGAVLLVAALAALPAAAQWSLSAGVEYESGRYGKPASTTEATIPLRADWRRERWRLRAELPLTTRIEGVASALEREEPEDPEEGDPPPTAPAPAARAQSGLSDLTLSAWYTLRDAAAARPGLAAGVRVKTPVVDGDRCLLTNGATDLSLEGRAWRPLGRIDATLVAGWTRRGDPLRRDANCQSVGGRTDLRNPLYVELEAGLPLARGWTLTAEYEYRQKLRDTSDPKSELSLGIATAWGRAGDVEVYAMTGFSDASPDFGIGVRLRWRP